MIKDEKNLGIGSNLSSPRRVENRKGCGFSKLIAAVLLSLVGLIGRSEAIEPKATIVAEVNKVSIPLTRLESERQIAHIEGTALDPEARRRLDRSILDRLIEREVLLQEADKLKVEIPDEEIKKTVVEFRKQFPEEQDYQNYLKQFGVDEPKLKEGVRADFRVRRLLEQEVFSTLSVSEETLRREYERRKEALGEPEEVRARHIFFRIPKNAEQTAVAALLAQAEDVRTQVLSDPTKFASLAKKYSDGPAQRSGGELGYFTRAQMPKAFSEAAFSLKIGEVSPVVQTETGLHLIMLEARRGGKSRTFEELRGPLGAELLAELKRKALEQYLRELRSRSKVVVYLK